MKLPSVEKSKNQEHTSIIKEKFKIIPEHNNKSPTFISNSLLSRMKEIKEVKIYLKEKFIQKEIDEQFLKDIEKEYAEQYLLKMKIFPTKNLIKKVLKLCPLKDCDFQLYDESIFINYNEKNVKSMHIFPVFDRKIKKVKNLELDNINLNSIKANKNILKRNNIKTLSDNKTISYNSKKFDHFKFNNYNKTKINKHNILSIETNPLMRNFFGTEDNFSSKKGMSLLNKNNFNTINSNTNTELLYNREKIDDLFAKYREEVTNIQLFNNNKSKIKINLSPENIRAKYIFSESNWSNKVYENKGKLSKISKSILSYKNVLNNEKYFFDLRYVQNLTEDIIKEINEPINPQIELIIKDMNYILDNFPFNEFIHIKNNNTNQTINESNETNNNSINYSFSLNKIEIKNNKEYLTILKSLTSNDSCRIIILCINLIYWIVLGGNRSIQIDANTKELIYLKLMKEWELFSANFKNKNLFYKIYIPLFIIMCRIEIENYFSRKYFYLFEDKKNKIIFLKKANAIISEIFDKHGYMNTFNLLCQKNVEFNKKFRINNIGHYKNKLYSTSNFVEMLFRNSDENLKNEIEVKEKENFIAEHKKKYFSFYLEKMNNNLKRRNLEPIFKIKFKSNEQKEEPNLLNINKKEINSNANNELFLNND